MTKKAFWLTLGFTFLFGWHIESVMADGPARKHGKHKWDWPVQGKLTDHFGSRQGTHFGVDIAAPKGTDIRVVAPGTVVKSYYSNSYGHVVFVRHTGGLETIYAHMSKRSVSTGDNITDGTVIGLVGSTGQSKGNHLHFEVHQGKWNVHKTKAINPLVLFDRKEKSVSVHGQGNSTRKETPQRTVTVEPGDTLWGIAEKYNTTVFKLKKGNNIASDIITVGQSLVVELQKEKKQRAIRETSGKFTANQSNKTLPTGLSRTKEVGWNQ